MSETRVYKPYLNLLRYFTLSTVNVIEQAPFCVARRGIWYEKTPFFFSLANPRENAEAVLQAYKLFVHVDTHIYYLVIFKKCAKSSDTLL